MSELFTTDNLDLRGYVPGTDWAGFNDNMTKLDAYYGANLLTAAFDTRAGRNTVDTTTGLGRFPMAPVARMDYAFEFVKKAIDEITEDSIYVEVLAAWTEDILNHETVPVPYPRGIQPPDNDPFNTEIQMVGNGIVLGNYAEKIGSKLWVKVPSVTSGPDAPFVFGPVTYDEADVISASGDYWLVYEEVSGEFVDLDQAATGDQLLPGQTWSGMKAASPVAIYGSNEYDYDEHANASGITKYLAVGWGTGHDPDFFGTLDTIRPPGYLSYRSLAGDMYGAAMLYIEALQNHLLRTEVGRYASMGSEVSSDLQDQDDRLEELQNKIEDDVGYALELSNDLIARSITESVHLSGDYVIHSGSSYDALEIQEAIDFLRRKVELHEENKTWAEIDLYEGVTPTTANVIVESISGEMVVWSTQPYIQYGTVLNDRWGRAVEATTSNEFRLAFPISDTRMGLEVPYVNIHDVHAVARNALDQGILKGFAITYVAAEE